MSIKAEKKELRQQILHKRAELPPALRTELSLMATNNLLQLDVLARARTILLFQSFGDEISTAPYREAALSRKQEIWLPLTNQEKRQIIPYVYTEESNLRKGPYGIMEPDPAISVQADRNQLDAIIIPGVAFDRHGGRLGYGGGYYDRFLASLDHKPLVIGFCFSLQLIADVPKEPHDFMVDYVVTENESIPFLE
ncbi:5-formyltetrahydrofolate cyclo-ligase [Brevibacillus sp. SYSU BS000544]|uniref:5-formyltetrahydrofolate cyclo-ligase n=1 Tax=Brevibacillus sp. SYSU BS000544 TaxID=3416443 RepID=UPI003CE54D1A